MTVTAHRFTPGTLAALLIAGLAVGTASQAEGTAKTAAPAKTEVKKAAAPKPPTKPAIPFVSLGKPVTLVIIEGLDEHNLISAITSDNEFVYLHMKPDARLRRGSATVAPAELREGMRLTCWGRWDRIAPDVFNASTVSVRAVYDDYLVRLKINKACRNMTVHRTETRMAQSSAVPLSAALDAAPASTLVVPTPSLPSAGSDVPTPTTTLLPQ